MNAPLIVFFVLAAIAVVCAINLVLQRHPIHSALSLIGVMVALAGLYLLLGAEFIAAAQIIVYAGAIMVLFVFVIMLLNAGAEERTNCLQARRLGRPSAGRRADGLSRRRRRPLDATACKSAAQTGGTAPTKALAALLFQEFVYPFELTSFLILIAIVGAIVLAQREKI